MNTIAFTILPLATIVSIHIMWQCCHAHRKRAMITPILFLILMAINSAIAILSEEVRKEEMKESKEAIISLEEEIEELNQ